MRVVYLGTTGFAAAVLRRLAESGHDVALTVTRPDRPKGRGRRMQAPPVAELAAELELPLAQPESLNAPESAEAIAAARPEALVVCAYGALIGDELLAAYEAYNVHPSLLPRWRGAAPVERSIQAGDAETGVCIMRPVAELDAGPVYLSRREPIEDTDDYGTLADRLAVLGGDLLVEALDQRPEPVAQAEEGVTYAAKIEAGDRRLDPAATAVELERTVRALHPHIGAWLPLEGDERLGVERAEARPGEEAPAGLSSPDGERLLTGTADGALELLEVKPPGKRAMAAADYLRGRVRADGHNAPRG